MSTSPGPSRAETIVPTPHAKSSSPAASSLIYHAHTLLLFIASDFKSVILPQSIFAVALLLSRNRFLTVSTEIELSALVRSGRLPLMVAWLCVHLLVLDVSNQRLPPSITEDTMNKPWRPLPSGRLSPQQARTVLLLAILAGFGCSIAVAGTTAWTPSVSLVALAWMYNDLEGSDAYGPWVRNALNAAGLACFGWGALTVLAADARDESGAAHLLPPAASTWLALTATVIMTTIQVHDFRDEAGDRSIGRRTVAVAMNPLLARGSTTVMVMFWSVVCPAFWCGGSVTTVLSTSSIVAWAAPVALGAFISVLLLLQRGKAADERAVTIWCLWMACLYLLPVLA
ncbi:UbiA prenyltransferase family-domain-containing protein [Mycena albidolilacea]|uniref:UbiA prenyltransferase family-domain-containing protein n=1 Tax=Mycena albidolilacea TaxID=1033008 RepID=A0AAD6Z8W8_9AGAR|nr:UbiA prenyltransferase family-domain-containing protein [Mycena albidolilacea]